MTKQNTISGSMLLSDRPQPDFSRPDPARQIPIGVGLFLALILWMFSLGGASAEPVRYELDGQHTQVIWSVNRFGFTAVFGSFIDVSGSMIIDESAPERSSVTAEILIAGVRSDLPLREEITRGPFWLDADEYPVISFASTEVTLLPDDAGQQRAEVSGNLTLHGVTAPVILHVTLNRIDADPVTGRRAAGFSATGSFARADFGIATAPGFIGNMISFQIEALAMQSE